MLVGLYGLQFWFIKLVEQNPLEWKNVSPYLTLEGNCILGRTTLLLGRTFPFLWSLGLFSLALLGRQLSCRSQKVKSSPTTSFVLTRIHCFRGKERGIYILDMMFFDTAYFKVSNTKLDAFCHLIWNFPPLCQHTTGLRKHFFELK